MQEEKRNKRRNNHNNAPKRTTKEQEATQYRPRTRRKETPHQSTRTPRNNDSFPTSRPRPATTEQSGSYRPRTLKKRDTTPQHTEQSQHNDEYTPPAHSNRKAKPSRTPFNKQTPTENLTTRPTKKSTKNKRSSNTNTTYEQGYSRPTRHHAPFQREDKHLSQRPRRRNEQENYSTTQRNAPETNLHTERRRNTRLGSASPLANHQRQANTRKNEYFKGIDPNSERRPNTRRRSSNTPQRNPKLRTNDDFATQATTQAPIDLTQPMRLNRFIAHCGQCSRREADDMITRGEISINGTVTTTLGEKIIPDTDIVTRNGEQLKLEQKVYILLNKPKDCFCTVEDEHATRTVLDIVAGACSERIYPVGRLDRNTTGLVLLTIDGELTEKLTHPSYAKQKTYEVTLDRKVTPQDMEKLYQGVTLDDGEFVQVDEIAYVRPGENSTVGVTIHTGQNRVVRRMFDTLGFRVEKLDRVIYAGLTKRNLPRGKWRFLTDDEIRMLKNDSYR